MLKLVGTSRRASPPRRVVCDFLRLSRQVPAVTLGRRLRLERAVAARQSAQPRPSWSAIFTKAYALVAARRPELRRAYLPFPWARFYDHPVNLAAIVAETRLGDEDVVMPILIERPETWPLTAIDERIRLCKAEPLQRIKGFRRALAIARLPWPLRRLLWWYCGSVSGYRRARTFGTFGLSTLATFGAELLTPLSPWSTMLHPGVLDARGELTMRLAFDHRVMDGHAPARALEEMEAALTTEILDELRRLEQRAA